MERVHDMLLEDEIVMCGIVMLLSIVAGAVFRLVWSVRRRRPTDLQ